MKTILKSIFLLSILAIAFNINAQDNTEFPDNAKDEITVTVEGLGCPYCAYGLERQLKDMKGMKKLTIDIETGVTKFKLPADQQVTLEQIEQQVEKAGYTPTTISISRFDGTFESNENNNIDKFETSMENPIGEIVNTMFTVNGTCNMCKGRIEKAAKSVEGVVVAEWDVNSEIIFVRFDNALTNKERIMQNIALKGHDTDLFKADDEVYKNLPGCCQYDRNETNK